MSGRHGEGGGYAPLPVIMIPWTSAVECCSLGDTLWTGRSAMLSVDSLLSRGADGDRFLPATAGTTGGATPGRRVHAARLHHGLCGGADPGCGLARGDGVG